MRPCLAFRPLQRIRAEDFGGDVAALLAWQEAMALVLLACTRLAMRGARRTSRAAQEQVSCGQ